MHKQVSSGINFTIVCIGFYVLFILLFSKSLADYDLWGYLSFGRIFWENGYFPYQDIFSYTPTKPLWIYHEWLTGVILYPLIKHLGSAGIQLLRYVFIVMTIFMMYRTAALRSASPVFTFTSISVGLILMSWGYATVIRAQIFTYFFFALSLLIAEYARKENNYFVLLWLLPIHILWCNLHGGFVAGLGLIVLYALGEGLSGRRFAPFFLIFAGSCLATLINPYGIEYWRYLVDAIIMPRPDITEWQSVLKSLKMKTFVVPSIIFLSLSIISITAIISRGKRYLTELLIVATLTYLGMKHIRHTVFLGIVFGVFMPAIIMEIIDSVAKHKSFIKMTWLGPPFLVCFYISISLIVGMLPSSIATRSLSRNKIIPAFFLAAPSPVYPTGALKWLEQNSFEGNILPVFHWGQYFIWTTYPKCKVAIDGRYETVYADHTQKEFFNFSHGREGWKIFLDKYHHDALVLFPNTNIYFLLLKEPGWKVVYSDQGSAIFLRRDIIRK